MQPIPGQKFEAAAGGGASLGWNATVIGLRAIKDI